MPSRQQQEEDEMIKERERASRMRSTRVKDLASKIDLGSSTSTSSSTEPGSLSGSSSSNGSSRPSKKEFGNTTIKPRVGMMAGAPEGPSRSVEVTPNPVGGSSSGSSSPMKFTKAPQATTPMSQYDRDKLAKQREKQARQVSTRVPNLASRIDGSSPSSRPGAQAVTPGARSVVGPLSSTSPKSSSSSQQQQQQQQQRPTGGSRRTSALVPNLTSKLSPTGQGSRPTVGPSSGMPVGPNLRSHSPPKSKVTTTSPKKMTQQEQDLLIKQRESNARRTSGMVPNLASKLSPKAPGSRPTVGPSPDMPAGPNLGASRSHTPPKSKNVTPKKMTQQEQDLLIKQRESAARRTSGMVPNLASKLSPKATGSRQTVGPSSGMPAGPNLSPKTTNKPTTTTTTTTPKKMTQQEQDLLIKQRESAARRTSGMVPNLASKLSPQTPGSRPTVGPLSSGMPTGPNLSPKTTKATTTTTTTPKKMTQQEQDLLLKQREGASRRSSAVVPNLNSKLSPKAPGSRPTVGASSVRPGAMAVSAPLVSSSSSPPSSSSSSSTTTTTTRPKASRRMSQDEQDSLIKQREMAARGQSAASVVPNLSRMVTSADGAIPTKPLTREEEDEAIKQREASSRRTCSAIPNLSRLVTTAAAAAGTGPPQRDVSNFNTSVTEMSQVRRSSSTATEEPDAYGLQARYHAAGFALGIEDGEELMMQGDLYATHQQEEQYLEAQQQEEELVEEAGEAVDSEEAVRARYRAAAIAMGTYTQEDEDQQIKAREKEAAAGVTVVRRAAPKTLAEQDEAAKRRARNGPNSDLVESSVDIGAGATTTLARSNVMGESSSRLSSAEDAIAKSRGRSERISARPSAILDNSDLVADQVDPSAAATQQAVVMPGAFACNMGEREQLQKTVLPVHPAIHTPEPILVTEDDPQISHRQEDAYNNGGASGGLTGIAEVPGEDDMDAETAAAAAGDDATTQAGTTAVETFREDSKKDDEGKKCKTWMWIVGVLLLLGIGGGVGGALAAGGGGDSPESPTGAVPDAETTDSPTQAPVVVEPEEVIAARSILAGVVSSTASLNYQLSPQYKALHWIATQDRMSTIPAYAIEDNPKFYVRYALAVFYFSLGGPSWMESSGWLDASTDECGWTRVTCAANGTVETIIAAEDTNMLGTIPLELEQLEGLKSLEISNNRINGIPGPLGSSIERLVLNNNQMEGRFPEGIYDMTALTFLDLSSNLLSGTISTDLSNLKELVELDLSENDFTGTLTSELHGLEVIEKITLSSNQFQGDFSEIVAGLSTLKTITIKQNLLSGSLEPGFEEQFPDLARLEVGSNGLSGHFPNFLTSMTQLEFLDLSNNGFTGTIATEIGMLSNLQLLLVERNVLTGSIPTEIGLMDKLRTLRIEFNELDQQIPSEMGRLGRLRFLSLQQNFLIGTVPTELGDLRILYQLAFESNFLTGTLPTELGLLEELTSLRVGSNELTGSVPAEICALPELDEIVVANLQDFTCDCGTVCKY